MNRCIIMVFLINIISGCASEALGRSIDRRQLELDRGEYMDKYPIAQSGKIVDFKNIGTLKLDSYYDNDRLSKSTEVLYECFIGNFNGRVYYLSVPTQGYIFVLSSNVPVGMATKFSDKILRLKFIEYQDVKTDEMYLSLLHNCDCLIEFSGVGQIANLNLSYNSYPLCDAIVTGYYIAEAKVYCKNENEDKTISRTGINLLRHAELTLKLDQDKSGLIFINNLKCIMYIITVPYDIVTFPFQLAMAFRSPEH